MNKKVLLLVSAITLSAVGFSQQPMSVREQRAQAEARLHGQQTISAQRAREIALGRYPGQIWGSPNLTTSNGQRVYQVRVRSGSAYHWVLIDPRTGRVIRTAPWEGPNPRRRVNKGNKGHVPQGHAYGYWEHHQQGKMEHQKQGKKKHRTVHQDQGKADRDRSDAGDNKGQDRGNDKGQGRGEGKGKSEGHGK